MRIVLAHNFYQLPGGEDQVFRAELGSLRQNGHDVIEFTDHNSRIDAMGRAEVALSTLWSRPANTMMADLVERFRPDVVHFHNTFPLLSPSCYYAAGRVREDGSRAAVVQTLHNYRLLCPRADFFREGRVCEDCTGRLAPWPAVVHGCYRESRSATAVAAGMLVLHRAIGTYRRKMDAFIALTGFARDKFIENGLPAAKVHLKPNAVADAPEFSSVDEGYGLFVGRLTEEKGIRTLIEALGSVDLPFRIAGDGPMGGWVGEQVARMPHVEWLGQLDRASMWRQMSGASFLVAPSLWYEGLPGVVLEAFAAGCPVIASNLGGLASTIDDGRTGVLFTPGDARALAARMRMLTSDSGLRRRIARAARDEFERKYTPQASYEALMRVYASARGEQRVPVAALGAQEQS